MLQNWTQKLRVNASISAGLLAGFVGFVASFAAWGLVPGRVLGDPLPLALAFGQLARSFQYFNWAGLLWHVVFAIVLGLLAVVILRWLGTEKPELADVSQTAALAAVINLGAVAVTEVDALMVAFWYLMASFISFMVTTTSARKFAVWLFASI